MEPQKKAAIKSQPFKLSDQKYINDLFEKSMKKIGRKKRKSFKRGVTVDDGESRQEKKKNKKQK